MAGNAPHEIRVERGIEYERKGRGKREFSGWGLAYFFPFIVWGSVGYSELENMNRARKIAPNYFIREL
jgi:hypothetical protein